MAIFLSRRDRLQAGSWRSALSHFTSNVQRKQEQFFHRQRRAVLLIKTTKMLIMRKLAVPVFLVLCSLTWCFPGGSDGNTTALFYCTEPGCALKVNKVFCNDEPVPFNSPMKECTGAPPPNTVCQRGGRAFVSTNTSGPCEFEADTYIQTKKCTDNTDVCDFTSGTTPPPLNIPESRNQDQGGSRTHYIPLIVVLVTGVVLVLLALYWRKPESQINNHKGTCPVRLTACLCTVGRSLSPRRDFTHTAEHGDSTQTGGT
ncbi:uncharacterized protein LOC114861846 isoform X2 [Betta splendens]|uniref:Uncharacterized protein LOC114861846 isoform X2 n=1 Tax=Betta splendens TaxID=158456 RepID=A0A8M1HHK2_BETSP|nr:uncharacterized protein LOC114861846 isoform X2 [Betta splendens]